MTGVAPAALNIARNRQPIAPAPKMTALSPGRGLALLTPLTTHASGSMSAATRVGGASDSGKTASAGAVTNRASAPSRKMPSARTFSQLAGRPARHGPHTPHFGSGSTVTRCPTRRPSTSGAEGTDAPDELVPHDHAGIRRVPGRDVEDLEVAAADAAGLDLDDDVVAALDDRLGDLLELDDPAALEDRCQHQPAVRRRRIRPLARRKRPRASAASPSVPRVTTSMTVATAFTSGVTPNFTRV